eukprot:CAMPEP_0178999154 /NCGR_PEP_ID=MMETSP0795-20121207/9895_1 /TAXON_ID=88552 /ORGANISM="Amoebophrya sp., Strain Ameob2" /LENGTH=113 /DNA_ID=CAMNT_0020691881 /DNA_START=381 /DNA_END=722 /DNA_ORIENTATION=-
MLASSDGGGRASASSSLSRQGSVGVPRGARGSSGTVNLQSRAAPGAGAEDHSVPSASRRGRSSASGESSLSGPERTSSKRKESSSSRGADGHDVVSGTPVSQKAVAKAVPVSA